VAVPVSWDELSSLKAANEFRIGDMEKRLKAADPWAEASNWRQSITAKMLEAVDAEID
jgi:bifunctional non-homologous end joining protein LigD